LFCSVFYHPFANINLPSVLAMFSGFLPRNIPWQREKENGKKKIAEKWPGRRISPNWNDSTVCFAKPAQLEHSVQASTDARHVIPRNLHSTAAKRLNTQFPTSKSQMLYGSSGFNQRWLYFRYH
jgi:hypothetical protein